MSGTDAQRIYYVSTVKWGARLVPPMSSETKVGWDNRGNYIDIIGFDVDGSVSRNGIKWTHGIYNGGSYTVIKGNRVHHIAQNTPCDGVGGAGIGVDSYYHGVQSAVIGNTVHDIGPANCRFVHGIYISTSGSAKNNIVHNIGGAAIQLWHDANNVVISNNTVAASMTGILVGGGDFITRAVPMITPAFTTTSCTTTSTAFPNRVKPAPTTPTATTSFSRAARRTGNCATASRTPAPSPSRPEFVRYARRGGSDFRLRSNSPTIGKGSAELAPLIDAHRQDARPAERRRHRRLPVQLSFPPFFSPRKFMCRLATHSKLAHVRITALIVTHSRNCNFMVLHFV
ncbi:right-handed parallel beta-helix repeat-containing protein [Massilia sp. B-10]|nr:right-handed parallel beta-helix repeat-containing protein [Massilia sp. B-10]